MTKGTEGVEASTPGAPPPPPNTLLRPCPCVASLPGAGRRGALGHVGLRGAPLAERFRAFRVHGCRHLRNEFVEEHRHLAVTAARRFQHRGEPDDDLVQVALLGLVKAVERFDPEVGVTFATFAMPTMLGELRRHFRDATWPLHVPRGLQELHLRLGPAREQLAHELGRSPTVAELAEAAGARVEDVITALSVGRAYRTDPLEAPAGESDGPAFLAVEDHELDRATLRLGLGPGIAGLSERDRRILRLRFVEGCTQAEIAGHLGLSQVQVSRLLRRVLVQLRRSLDATAV